MPNLPKVSDESCKLCEVDYQNLGDRCGRLHISSYSCTRMKGHNGPHHCAYTKGMHILVFED